MRLEDGKQGGEEDGGHRELDRDAPERLTLRALPSEDHGPDSETGRGPHYLQRSQKLLARTTPGGGATSTATPTNPTINPTYPSRCNLSPGRIPNAKSAVRRGATAIRMAERFPDVVASPTYSRSPYTPTIGRPRRADRPSDRAVGRGMRDPAATAAIATAENA